MGASQIIASVRAIGRQLSARSGSIIVSAGDLELPERLRNAVRDNKAEILALLAIPEATSASLTAARTAGSSKAETRAERPPMVRCATCRHLDANKHTPALGWSGCNAGKGGHWPAATHICNAFKDKEPQP
jgi:hypothetical protein